MYEVRAHQQQDNVSDIQLCIHLMPPFFSRLDVTIMPTRNLSLMFQNA